MSKQFFITGLPRSRTAWFANLFTWGDSFCWHEGKIIPGMPHDVIGRALAQTPTMNQGVSDPALALHWKTVRRAFPSAKWVVIDRVLEDATYSSQLIHQGITNYAMTCLMNRLEDLAKSTDALVVPFEDIGVEKCMEIADYLDVEIGPVERIAQLCDMNIQIHPPVLKARLEALKVNKLFTPDKAA